MSNILENKIEADDVNINHLLKDQKFTIDYFQREYRWQEKHINLLVDDLTSTFTKSYNSTHERPAVVNYQNYYLGPIVFCVNNGKKSIVDGQQRITSITLFLIYLNHLQKDFEESNKVAINDLIFSASYGVKSFNMSDENREACLKALYEKGEYQIKDDDDETVQNIVNRYHDIELSFPDELSTEKVLPYFIDWLKENVVIVEIKAYSDENAYTIFETMNDRGLNLTPTEMLKGYVLSKVTDKSQRNEINDIWRREIQKLHEYDENADQTFFQSWFRGKYAVSIRPGKVGSEDQDFELIGTRFHNWFKDNHKSILNLNNSEQIYDFFKNQFPFFVKWYLKIGLAQRELMPSLPHTFYIKQWGIAESLQNPLLLAPINFTDDENTIIKKIEYVSRYIETYAVRRAINYRKFGSASIRYTMSNLVKLIRDNDLTTLGANLTSELNNMAESWEGVADFGLHMMNGNFVKHLLSRISSYVDNLVGKDTTYLTYHNPTQPSKQFQIEHIWANKFEDHDDEFTQENDFSSWRNSIGALILLPQGTNQSFNSDKYEDKIAHYLKENTYAQTLNENYYLKNPNFYNSEIVKKLGFKAHQQFKKEDIVKRKQLVKSICENLWSTDFFKHEGV